MIFVIFWTPWMTITRKMKKSGSQNMTNIENQIILRKFLHKYKPVTPSYPRRKSVGFAGGGRRTDGRTDEHQISEASYTKSPCGAINNLRRQQRGEGRLRPREAPRDQSALFWNVGHLSAPTTA